MPEFEEKRSAHNIEESVRIKGLNEIGIFSFEYFEVAVEVIIRWRTGFGVAASKPFQFEMR
jgi:hypothetical protein